MHVKTWPGKQSKIQFLNERKKHEWEFYKDLVISPTSASHLRFYLYIHTILKIYMQLNEINILYIIDCSGYSHFKLICYTYSNSN